ncbi:MAG: hypothetical protein K6B74_04755 [Ruminococcus sp.]|nr:hypothetical protein [Ruminococcus sp.]
MNYVVLYEANASRKGADSRYLYIERVGLRGNICEITVRSDESIVELYLNGELRYRQKGIGEFVFCCGMGESASGGGLSILARSRSEKMLSDEVTVSA